MMGLYFGNDCTIIAMLKVLYFTGDWFVHYASEDFDTYY